EGRPVVAKLVPTGIVTGRIMYAYGQPIEGVEVGVNVFENAAAAEVDNYLRRHREPERTDKEGRFRLSGVIPGLKFSLFTRPGRTALAARPPIGMKEVKPGATLNLGEIRMELRMP